jgi:hypothetical protein
MSEEEVEVTFRFPRELVEKANIRRYLGDLRVCAMDENLSAAARLGYLTYLQILDWQEANRYRVTPDTPPGTEVEIIGPGYETDPNYRVWLVGPDPRAGGAVVDDELQGYLLVEWEYLRLVKLLPQEVEAYGGG